jgi:NifU-like protein involved in Fe-S cluster formation
MHSAAVLERARNPQRVGSLPRDARDVGTGETGSLESGTVARIQVRVADGRIAEARFKVFGCSAAIASASLVAERLEGAPVRGAVPPAEVIAADLALPDERRAIADLVVHAAEQAIADWEQKADR